MEEAGGACGPRVVGGGNLFFSPPCEEFFSFFFQFMHAKRTFVPYIGYGNKKNAERQEKPLAPRLF